MNVRVNSQTDPKLLQVIWDEIPRSERNGIIVMYEIQYIPLTTFNGIIGLNTNTTDKQAFILAGLEEAIFYNISVRGYTVVGPGPYSPDVTHQTNEGSELNTWHKR